MYAVLIISIIIVIVVLILAVMTTSKAYTYKHTVDPLDDHSNNQNEAEQNEEKK